MLKFSLKDWLYYALICMIWGSSYLWIKITLQELNPWAVVSYRLTLALVGIWFITLFYPKSTFQLPQESTTSEPRTHFHLFVLAVFQVVLPFALIAWGQQHIDAGVGSAINATVPIFTLLFAVLLFRTEQFSPTKILGTLIGFLGVLLIIQGNAPIQNFWKHQQANGALLLGCVFYGIASNYANLGPLRSLHPLHKTRAVLFWSTLLCWAGYAISPYPWAWPMRQITWAGLTWLGILGSGVAFILYYVLLKRLGASLVASSSYFYPAIGITIGNIFLREAFSASLILGTLLILFGLFLARVKLNLFKFNKKTRHQTGNIKGS